MQSGKRVGHRKSRNGCLRCKARRVKCDELRPCTNCIRHKVHCSLLLSDDEVVKASSPAPAPLVSVTSAEPVANSSASSVQVSEQPEQDTESLLSAHHVANEPSHSPACHHQGSVYSATSPAYASPDTGFRHHDPGYPCSCQCSASDWMRSLQLFHHYNTTVWRVFVRESHTTDLWKDILPNAALSHDFLMHAVLAVSALHYAHFNPPQRTEYHLVSAHYSTLALSSFRNLLNDINEENCEVFFLFGSLIYVLSLCNVANPSGPLTCAEVAHSFQLLHGIKVIIEFKSFERWSSDGPLGQLFRQSHEHILPSTPKATSVQEPPTRSPFDARIDKLCQLARQLPRSLDVINPQSAALLALEGLRNTHSDCILLEREKQVRRTWVWGLGLSHLFLDLISSGDPVALIILAHFAALCWPFEHKEWASQGWSVSVMSMIERVLDEEWHKWIAWPKKSLEQKIPVDAMVDDQF